MGVVMTQMKLREDGCYVARQRCQPAALECWTSSTAGQVMISSPLLALEQLPLLQQRQMKLQPQLLLLTLQ
jgi:hypothetical protein